MKPALIVAALLGITTAPLAASNVVLSNFSESNSADTALQDSQGHPLPVGSFVLAGTFPGLATVEVAALANSGADDLVSACTVFGAAVSMGSGSSGTPGMIEFTASAPLTAEIEEGLYAVVLNGASPAQATECLVLKFSSPVPADDPSGLPGYLAVHLREAAVVFGARTASGFTTRATGSVPGGFEAWILTQAAKGADLLPDGDADADGVTNLLEYAFGSGAGDGASLATLEILPVGENHAVQYLRRVDDPVLVISCETVTAVNEDTWFTLNSPVATVADDPRPVPAGYERVRQLLPAGMHRAFARLRVSR